MVFVFELSKLGQGQPCYVCGALVQEILKRARLHTMEALVLQWLGEGHLNCLIAITCKTLGWDESAMRVRMSLPRHIPAIDLLFIFGVGPWPV